MQSLSWCLCFSGTSILPLTIERVRGRSNDWVSLPSNIQRRRPYIYMYSRRDAPVTALFSSVGILNWFVLQAEVKDHELNLF